MNARAALWGCFLVTALVTSAHADEQLSHHWIARIGVHPVNPKPDSHAEFSVDNAAGLSLGATYLLTEHWAVELFSTFPTGIDLHDAAGARAARFSMIPSSATLQYHITDASGVFRAYAGAGLSYTHLGSERTKASLTDQTLQLDDSYMFGLSVGRRLR